MRTLILGTAWLGSALAVAQGVAVTGRLVDQAGIPKQMLQKAQAEAAYAAATGGVTLQWVDSAEPRDFTFVVKDCECGVEKATLAQTLLGNRTRVFTHTSISIMSRAQLTGRMFPQATYSATSSLMNLVTS